MTGSGASVAPGAGAPSHLARDQSASEFSEVSFASTITEDQDLHYPPPMLAAASSADLLSAQSNHGTNGFSSTVTLIEPEADSAARSTRSFNSDNALHKSKQLSDGHHVDPEHKKSGPALSTIDETSAAAANGSSYTYADSYGLPSNGYVQDDDGARRYRQHMRIASPDLDEARYSPSTYPPTSEEDSEAKRVQQNLERWAAEERQRRKAQRSSRILSNRSYVSSGAGGLAHRLSILRPGGFATNVSNLGAGPSSERLADGPGASLSLPYNAPRGDRRRESTARRGSASSSTSGARGLGRSSSSSSLESSPSLGSMVSDDHCPNRNLPRIGSRVSSAQHPRSTSETSTRSYKAKDTIARDPFRDPSAMGTEEGSPELSRKRSSLKPTPTASRPIVTVGRASSMQRRALEAKYNTKGKGKGRSMPTIVATDTEAEAELEGLSSRMRADQRKNPFTSSQDHHGEAAATSMTIHQGGLDEDVAMEMEMAGKQGKGLNENGDLGESTLDTEGGSRPPPARTSTSSSKFRELGITEGDDWIVSVGRKIGKDHTRKMQVAQHPQRSDEGDDVRKPWWTELLCGCSRDYDDDEQVSLDRTRTEKAVQGTDLLILLPLHHLPEQAGRTNPME